MELTNQIKDKKPLVIKLLLAVGIMSIIDGIISYIGLKYGYMEEGNPLMENLWLISPLLFLTFKLGVSLLIIVVGLLYLKTEQPIRIHIRFATYFITALYVYIMLLHILWISII